MITDEDFARSDRFLLGKATDTWNGDIGFAWLEGGAGLGFKHEDAKGAEFRRVSVCDGAVGRLFDHAQMAAALANALGRDVDPAKLPIDRIVSANEGALTIACGGKNYVVDLNTWEANPAAAARNDIAVSPDGAWEVFARDHNVFLRNVVSGAERPVTTDGVEPWAYAAAPTGNLSSIFMQRNGISLIAGIVWSPDSRRFVFHRLDEREVPELHLLQAAPDDGSMRPKLHSYRMGFPGEPVATAEHFIYDIAAGRVIRIDLMPMASAVFVPGDTERIVWNRAGDKVHFIDSDWRTKKARLIRVDAASGATHCVLEESHPNGMRVSWALDALPGTVLENGDAIWFSERDGWGHYYLYDQGGTLKHALTSGDWLARDILHVDEQAGFVYLVGSGREPGDTVYDRRLYRVTLDGVRVELLTPEAGDHQLQGRSLKVMALFSPAPALSMAPDGGAFVDRFGGIDRPATWVLRRANGDKVAELAVEDLSPLPPFTMPEPFTLKSADGAWDLHGVLLKPASFDPSKSYPIIDHVYPGPQVSRRPSSLTGGAGFDAALFGDAQALADLGFVVMMIDGRGTPGRSREFVDLSYGYMERAGTLEDHVAALQHLARQRPYIDLSRVGIVGASGGGFATMQAMVQYPEVFKVGVASCGNFEQRNYHAQWGETYHGLPGESDYEKVFPGAKAAAFKGKLLLATGDMDDNVHPSNTLKMAQALIKAGKQFDMLVMPNVHHGIHRDPYFLRVSQIYLVKHLMGETVPSDADLTPAGGYAASCVMG